MRGRPSASSEQLDAINQERVTAINAVWWYGAAFELEQLPKPLDDDKDGALLGGRVNAIRTPSAKTSKQKRKGANAAKKLEMGGNLADPLSRRCCELS